MENLEKRILKELKYGSKKAFEYVFKTYYDSLCRYAEEILKDRDQAEDVVENLFIVIWEDRIKIDIHTSFRSYLYRSTYNACLNIIRKRKSESKYRDFFLNHSDFSKFHDYGSSSYPLSGIIEKEMESDIAKIIDALPPQCKKVFLMSRVDDLSHLEIADKLDLSVNTVKSHIMNALKKIQVALKNMMIVLVLLTTL
ncbi:MAG: RNA polymerase sigma-70 factor [Bacteroidales bacterium]